MEYVLARKSPRRKELLERVIPDFTIDVVETNEVIHEGIDLHHAIENVAKEKGKAVASHHSDAIIISADTIVCMGQTVYGKPKDREDAIRMLRELSGETHEVITGVCIMDKNHERTFSVSANVTFYPLSEKEIIDYVNTNEPLDKAGAYGIQGYGALLIEKIDGDYYSIMGLPIARLKRELEKF